MQPANIGDFVTAARHRIHVTGFIPLYVQLGYIRVRAWFCTIDQLVSDLLLRTSFMNRYSRAVFLPERQIDILALSRYY